LGFLLSWNARARDTGSDQHDEPIRVSAIRYPAKSEKNYQFWSVCELVDNPDGCWSEDKGDILDFDGYLHLSAQRLINQNVPMNLKLFETTR
jgi:hypothetical protein